MNDINTVIFDFGGVLIDWNPRYVYRQIFDSEEKIDWFFENICTMDWNEDQDAGRSLHEATSMKIMEFPEYAEEIKAYYGRWEEMLGGPIQDTVEIFNKLRQNEELKIYGLTNWSAETFPVALERYSFLHEFDGIVVSGQEKTRKPFKEIYDILLNRYTIQPQRSVFIDDNARNVEAAQAIGINSIHFQGAPSLAVDLENFGLNLY